MRRFASLWRMTSCHLAHSLRLSRVALAQCCAGQAFRARSGLLQVLQFNSASYGQTPTIVNNARAQWEALSHANPSRWQVRRRAQPIRRYPPARGRSMPHGKERASGSGFHRRLRSSALPRVV